MSVKERVTILGDGGWGTALALVNARRGNDVLLWSAFADYVTQMKERRENFKFLPNVPLPASLQISSDLSEALQFSEIIVLAIPTQFLRGVLQKVRPLVRGKKIYISVAKGIEKQTCMRPSQIVYAELGDVPLVILSGPSHAEEVSRGIPTLVVAASKQAEYATKVQDVFRDKFFRVYVQQDPIGVELGGALKNVVAVAAGVCDGLGFGDNTKSGLLTRGLFEMSRLGVKMGANPTTFFGLSGAGDLMTTCFSNHGRNLFVGRELGKGRKIKDIVENMQMVAEGVASAEAVHELAQREGITLPIMDEVYNILCRDKDPKQAVADLLSRDAHEEWKQY